MTPRQALFSSAGSKACPVNPDDLYPEHATYIHYIGGAPLGVIENPWNESDIAHAQLKEQWVGFNFSIAKAAAGTPSPSTATPGSGDGQLTGNKNIRPHIL